MGNPGTQQRLRSLAIMAHPWWMFARLMAGLLHGRPAKSQQKTEGFYVRLGVGRGTLCFELGNKTAVLSLYRKVHGPLVTNLDPSYRYIME